MQVEHNLYFYIKFTATSSGLEQASHPVSQIHLFVYRTQTRLNEPHENIYFYFTYLQLFILGIFHNALSSEAYTLGNVIQRDITEVIPLSGFCTGP
jgi:hypothetical protein